MRSSDEPKTAHTATQETGRSYPSFSLRSRKSNFNLPTPPNDATLPQKPTTSKIIRRESRLGLRHIFSRSKLRPDDTNTVPVPEIPQRSVVTATVQTTKNDLYSHKPPSSSSTVLSTASGSATSSTEPTSSSSVRHLGSSLGRTARRSLLPRPVLAEPELFDDSETPVLYQAYHQSIRQATLSAPSISADAVLKQKETADATIKQQQLEAQESNRSGRWGSKDKSKKKIEAKRTASSSSSSFRWTTKIFLLTTNGRLLQYDAEGHYERRPEKILKLSSISAAFVTDCIPGQHWVLQVSADPSASINPESIYAVESRSLFSKEPLVEARHAANLLMVFENANDMDGWITAVRSEIRKLMDNRVELQRVVVPKTNIHHEVRERSSQRTLTADRSFSANHGPEHGQAPSEAFEEEGDATITLTDFDKLQDQCMDDASITNSVVSHEGRQLESLRDSAHRLSVVSSSQRTFITSTTSSPATSPTLDSFPRQSEEVVAHRKGSVAAANSPRDSRSRTRRDALPGAGLLIGLDAVRAEADKPRSNSVTTHSRHSSWNQSQDGGTVTPNFSMPTSASRRFSHSRSSSSDLSVPPSPTKEKSMPRRQPRGKPPPSLRTSRPLSSVADHPSPHVSLGDRRNTYIKNAARQSPGILQNQLFVDSVARRPSLPISEMSSDSTSRPNSRHQQLDPNSAQVAPEPTTLVSIPVSTWNDEKRRRRVSMDPSHGRGRRSPTLLKPSRRLTARQIPGERTHRRNGSLDSIRSVGAIATMLPPPRAPPPTIPLPAIPTQHSGALKSGVQSKASLNRRSMPHIAIAMKPSAAPSLFLPQIPQASQS